MSLNGQKSVYPSKTNYYDPAKGTGFNDRNSANKIGQFPFLFQKLLSPFNLGV